MALDDGRPRRIGRVDEGCKHFTHRIDMCNADGNEIIEHLANVEDFEVAMATYHAACLRWPTGRITLRQDGRVIVDRGVPLLAPPVAL